MNRIQAHIEAVRVKFDALAPTKQGELDAQMDLEFDEHFRYQEEQARAHAMGELSTDEAAIVYHALGEVGSPANGGWAAGTDTPTKVSVTMLMGELLARRVKASA